LALPAIAMFCNCIIGLKKNFIWCAKSNL